MKRLLATVCAGLVALAIGAGGAQAQQKEVTVGYQQIYGPWIVAIHDGAFEKATGYKIRWVQFESGAKVITAMASGDVHIALAGSSPIAAAVSRGLDVELFWIIADIAAAEALVVRDGAGIEKPEDIKGKKVGIPFVSTTHFHMLFFLEHHNIDPKEVRLLDMQPAAIAAAWERGDIDAAFVWDPALGRIKQTGKVLVTSGELSKLGKATFDGLLVNKRFARENEDFMVNFVKTLAAADDDFRKNPDAYGPESENAKKIVKMVGGEAKEVQEVMSLYGWPTLEEQASNAWLGGGKDGGAARALFFTAEFLKKEKRLDDLLPDYGVTVNDSFVRKALGK